MARMAVQVYKNSAFATLISICGSVCFIIGLYGLFGGEIITGIILLGLGAVFTFYLAPLVARKKQFKLWVKHLESNGILEKMSTSEEVCFQVYQANRCVDTINLIRKYNPDYAMKLDSATSDNLNL